MNNFRVDAFIHQQMEKIIRVVSENSQKIIKNFNL